MTKPSRVHARADLVQALTVLTQNRSRTRSFLEGLATDELRYIADFFGATTLDPQLRPRKGRAAIARRVEMFQRRAEQAGVAPVTTASHKMILLLEFLSLSQSETRAMSARVGAA